MEFSGFVLDTEGNPVNKAIVRIQGANFSAVTDRKGHFEIIVDEPVSSKYLTAWKYDFYNGGAPFSVESTEYSIILKRIPKDDNKDYVWRCSAPNEVCAAQKGELDPKTCRECHMDLTDQWSKSTHGASAINPFFLSFFDASGSPGRQDAGPSYKADFPNSDGNCSTCHAPILAVGKPFNADPRQAQGAAKEGVSCDLCHKIDDVLIDNTGGYPGIMSIRFRRPSEGNQVFYGPYDDVFPGDDSYHPLYKESRYCAPCHHGKFWDVLIYSEFQEWVESDYSKKNIHCQTCHMKPDGKLTHFASPKEGGLARNPETIPSHLFSGVGDREFMTEAIELSLLSELKGDLLTLTVEVKNVKAGHHYPTGNPMRQMIMVLDVTDDAGNKLPLMDGERVPEWGGVGAMDEGNYAGLPGKGFAKVLRDSIPYPDGRFPRHFRPEYPAPHWRPVSIESDNRIPANGADISRYVYRIPKDERSTILATATLIFRRGYKKWMDAKGFRMDDLEIARKCLTLGRK